ncbi:PREDICTED: multivesicular body subunit 12A [Gavialis gangeticus]|uniref:multivesicular body subunit 12A n=1 Tax=Gavialis gangeticus TaxID=94835 RepID=UPI00092E34A1|nr:PREDICTED: multivesicular body subunit 12A [Gavialis gangeticus]
MRYGGPASRREELQRGAMSASAEPVPLSGVAWASSPAALPAVWTPILSTVEGAAANFGKGFGQKSSYYLCQSCQAGPGDVVADVQVLGERTALPAGYTYAQEFLEPRTAISKKKRVCVRLVPVGTAELVVFDIKLSSKSKAIPHYVKIGEIGSFAIWCKKGHAPKPKPLPKPRNISLTLKQLSLETAEPNQAKVEFPSEKSATHFGSKHTSLKRHDSIYEASNLYGISAMDGVPFTLHPKFESSLTRGTHAFSFLNNLNIKSLADIEKEYDYTFVVERTAAARLPPSIC